ncbi:MAG: T9SS type A sorting domain-containing protein [Bacteroidales bacterium]|nr:T9SS type A sorting domain-containing protein [Bacteroidales bacterium]
MNQEIPVNQPPSVNISSPTKGISFITPATITIDAIASDIDGTISKVEFYQGSTKLGERTIIPYYYTWKDVPEGTYSITAVATDNKNSKTTSAPVIVVVEKSATGVNQAPVVSIISPSTNKKYKKQDKVVIVAEASDPDGTISKVEFKNGTVTLAEILTAPYTYTWEAIDTGTFEITVISTDNLGAISTSAQLELVVGTSYDINPETINLYPNPNDGVFSIELSSPLPNQSNKIKIVNIKGQIVYDGVITAEETTRQLDISHVNSGTYVLIITSGNSANRAMSSLTGKPVSLSRFSDSQ